MINPEQSAVLPDNLTQILEIMNSISRRTAGGDYIFRGEPKNYDKVSSNLFRLYQTGEGEDLSIDAIQQGIVDEAKKYTTETDQIVILSELQHYGGRTNLIDFTADYLVALFFACDGFPLEDGRLILLNKTGPATDYIKECPNVASRPITQKSIFVMPPQGFVEPDDIFNIPKNLKEPLLEYLRRNHNVSTETIYNDLHGFIRQQKLHEQAYRELHLAITYHREDNPDLNHAIDHYTQAISLNPRLDHAYCGRGGALFSNGDIQRAIQDFNKALEIDETHSCAYTNRGKVYLQLKNFDDAIRDFGRSIELNRDLDNSVASRSYYFRGMAYLETKKLDRAIQDFDRSVQIDPDDTHSYCGRGICHVYKGNYVQAIGDFDRAIELAKDHICAFHNRGVTHLFLCQWDMARTDLITAKDLGADIETPFRADFGSVATFEGKYEVAIPEDIAEMLGG